MKNIRLFLGLLVSVSLTIPACNRIEKEMKINTGEVTEIMITTVKVSGEILDLGEGATSYGHCYAITPNPVFTGGKSEFSNPVLGDFTSSLAGLSASTKYYVRAYISRGTEVVYGSETSFTTLSDAMPVLITNAVSDIQQRNAVAGGTINDQGGTPVTARGVCWSLLNSPSVALTTKTSDGSGTGPFNSSLTGLEIGTKYYVRAFATNDGGTAYGNEVEFTTKSNTYPTIETAEEVTSVTDCTALCGGDVKSEGGSPVSEKGVCWNLSSTTTDNPEITDSKTSDGSGLGSFESILDHDISPNQTYRVRAYAINLAGPSYGDVRYFRSCIEPSATTEGCSIKESMPSAYETTGYTLSATANNSGNKSTATVTFEYGTTTYYGSIVAAGTLPANSSSLTKVSATITGSVLLPKTIYHYRVKVVNCGGTIYGLDRTFTTDYKTVTDVNGTSYNVIRIGTQLWMKENLKVTNFNDGTSISKVESTSAWGDYSTPQYCFYSNNSNYNNIYGKLYNWAAVTSVTPRLLCPSGWHVPTDTEWSTLVSHLGGDDEAGGKLKETGTTHWTSPNTCVTPSSGFTFVPGGYRDGDGAFGYLGTRGTIWLNKPSGTQEAYRTTVEYNIITVVTTPSNRKQGRSVRCIKNP